MISSEATSSSAGVDLSGQVVVSNQERAKTVAFQLKGWTARLVVADALAAAVAAGTALTARFGLTTAATAGVDYRFLAAALIPLWLLAMTFGGTYDSRYIAAGAEHYRRILNGGVWLLALLSFISFASHADVSRAFVFVSIPLVTVLTLGGRYAIRKSLHRRFASDWSAHRVLAIGSAADVADLAIHMHRASYAGFRVVAALTPGEARPDELPAGVAWGGEDPDAAVRCAGDFGADTVAVAGSHLLGRGGLRRLSWGLEGTDIQLVVAPGMTDLAGPRIRTRPIDGLPLLHIEKPQFTGARRVLKDSIDIVAGTVLLVGLLPVMIVIAVAVRLTSRGPVIFRQQRVGQHGRHFALLKFRTMLPDAETERKTIEHLNEHNGVLFKIRRDPRVTPVGTLLRRFSLDELPQLLNVVRGQMSLVGPRPPLPSEVDRYGEDVHRRLLVKPGLTGLWQVSGRSDLSWDESVRLDLHYVDHWSVGLDLVLLGKTLMAILRGRGAY